MNLRPIIKCNRQLSEAECERIKEAVSEWQASDGGALILGSGMEIQWVGQSEPYAWQCQYCDNVWFGMDIVQCSACGAPKPGVGL